MQAPSSDSSQTSGGGSSSSGSRRPRSSTGGTGVGVGASAADVRLFPVEAAPGTLREDATPASLPPLSVGSEVSGTQYSSVRSLRRAAVSAWRWPARPGEMPVYVQRNFRLKSFGLITVQLAIIFIEMVLVHWFLRYKLQFDTGKEAGQMLFYGLGAVTLFVILWLHFLKDWYPVNYVLLVVVTVLVGLFWGLTPINFGRYLHFQVIGILVIAMAVSTGTSALLTTEKVRPWHAVFGSHMLGWMVGAACDVVVVTAFGFSTWVWTLVALALTFCLLAGVLLLDAGQLLIKCNPDDFMSVVVAMDSALLVVSMPVFVLSCCLLHAAPGEGEGQGEQAGGAIRAGAAGSAQEP